MPKRSPSPVEKILEEASGNLSLVEERDPGPLEAFSTDFTEVLYGDENRKAHLMAVVDLESKSVPGWAVLVRVRTESWLCAVGSAFASG
jgi:putative transposase